MTTPAKTDVTSAPAIVDKVLEIGRKRRQILGDMRTAIEKGDRELVFNLAKRLTGLSDETSARTGSRLN